ncbi:MAG: hypothetical protein V3U95_08530 [Dehalococcoidia bacterium]
MIRLLKQLLQDQKGYATFALALIGMLVVSFIVVPFLGLLPTHLIATEKSASRLIGMYSAGSGVEYTLWELLNNPNFDSGLSPTTPSKNITVESNEETITVTVTKVFTSETLQGQGMDIDKQVTPTSASAGVPETYTYTLTLTNIGTGTNTINQVVDLLPAGFAYVPGSTTGLTTFDPSISSFSSAAAKLLWYPKDGVSSPYPWEIVEGEDSLEGTYTPAQSTWETVPTYWEMAIPVDGQFVAGNWKHKQRWYTTENNQWRWMLQLVEGAQVTDLFTSASGNLVKNETKRKDITYAAGAISLQAGDALRLRLEVFSDELDPADRLFQYRWGGANGYDTLTETPGFFQTGCGPTVDQLTWTIADVPIGTGAQATLTFQATATKPDGTYSNQAWGQYEAWWDLTDKVVNTPPTAPVTVGTGELNCGEGIKVSKSVDPLEAEPGVETTFTFTISIENTMLFDLPLDEIDDLLPPGFTYVASSSSGFWPYDPNSIKLTDSRWNLRWHMHMAATLPAGQTVTQTFQATATLDTGYDYANEAWVDWKEAKCPACPPNIGGDNASYSSPTAVTQGPPLYDLQAVAADGTILARIQLWEVDGQVDILSWQEY